MSHIRRTHLYTAFECALLAGALTAGVVCSRPDEWHPIELFLLLLLLGVGGDRLAVTVRNQNLSAALRGARTGDDPARAAAGDGDRGRGRGRRRAGPRTLARAVDQQPRHLLRLPVRGRPAGALAARRARPANAQASHSVEFALIVFGVFIGTNLLNFAMIAPTSASSAAAAWSTRPATC